jgi:hypothetical protein
METDEALRAALKRAAAALKAANVPFALSGGYASWARGGPHREHDVDFVLPPDAVPHARRVLQDAGFRAVQPPRTGWRRSSTATRSST